MRAYQFTVPGKPQGKARPRFNGKTRRTYTPQKTINYEQLVRNSYLALYAGEPPLDGALKAEITAFFPIPKSVSKSKRDRMLSGEIKPTVKPDADNIIKAILDALNGAAYKDDAAVIKVTAEKRYSDEPRVEVKIMEGNIVYE
ncbi:MAG: RusA family crossover junction endodeoxyribonuclease [Lachnospiraceae bacterium]|nr:RusA family crossover junction endodeoxyribonuclease [Lachnospiraceae bacterium]